MRTTTLISLVATAVLLAGCLVPDKFFSDAGAGDDTGDGGVDIDGDIEDVTAPETMIDSAPAALSNDATPTFEFSADEPATFLCSIDAGAPEACTSPFSPTLTDGPHTFSVAAVDTVGNQDETPADHAWSMDTVAPETTITMGPPANDNSATVMLSFTSDEADVTYECTYDGTAAPCTSPSSHTAGNGNHTFSVRATDPSGNVDATPATHAWTTDLSTPDTTIDAGPATGSSVSSTSATFTFSSPNAGGSATFECALDAAAFAACTSPRTVGPLSEASHTFQVRVRNAAGTADPSPASRTWTVDVTDPTTAIATGPVAGSTVQSTSAAFTFTSNEATATFQCALDTPTFTACPASHTLTGLAQGSHTLQVRAVDAALNVDDTPASRQWSVDTVGPTVTINSPPSPTAGSTSGPRVTFGFTASEGTPQCRVDSEPFAACTSPLSYSLPEGAHRFDVRASDALGNVTTVSRTWTVDCTGVTMLGSGGFILFHFDEPGTAATNQVVTNGYPGDGSLGANLTYSPTDDPERINNGRFGRALEFLVADRDNVRWSDGTVPVRNIHDHSIEFWVRPSALMSNQVVADLDEVEVRYTSTAAGVRFSYEIAILGAPVVTISSPPVVAGAWQHVVATYSGATMRLYLNGALVDSGSLSVGGTPFALTNVFVGPGGSVEGDIDEVFMSAQAMSAADVLDRYCPL